MTLKYGKPYLLKPGDLIQFVAPESETEFIPGIKNYSVWRIKDVKDCNFKTGIIIDGTDFTNFSSKGYNFTDIDLSNSQTGLKLYPNEPMVLNQIIVGFRGEDDTIVHVMCPSGKYLQALQDIQMYPSTMDPFKVEIGAISPKDSPIDNPKLTLEAVKDYESIVLRVVNLSADYRKLNIWFRVRSCKFEKVPEEEVKGKKAYIIKKYNMY